MLPNSRGEHNPARSSGRSLALWAARCTTTLGGSAAGVANHGLELADGLAPARPATAPEVVATTTT